MFKGLTHFLRYLLRSHALFLLLLCLPSLKGWAMPDSSSTFVAPDSEFIMKVARVNNEILIALKFNPDIAFENLSIERKASFEASFSQCRYITYDEVATKNWFILKRDKYPYSAQTDILYRVRYVTKDGVLRIFPSVMLPSITD